MIQAHEASVTVGLPFANQPVDQLEAAIRSVLNQTFTQWRLILVSDGAPPSVVRSARSFTDDRIVLVEEKTTQGLAKCLNQIASLTTTSILIRMDADDVMTPGRLSAQVQYLEEHPNVDVVGSRAYIIDEEGHLRGGFVEPPLPDSPDGYLRSNAFTHPTVAGRTEWFKRNPYDERRLRVQDKALWLASNTTSTFHKMPQRLLYYRVTSRANPAKQRTSSRADRSILREFAPGLIGWPRTLKILCASFARQIMYFTASHLGFDRTLYQRRIESLSPAEAEVARVDLAVATSSNYLPDKD